MKTTGKKILAVAGLGYVGLPLALLARKKGYRVLGVDIDQDKVDKINKGISPFGKYFQGELSKYPIKASTNFDELPSASIIIICVPTPVLPSKLPDYRHIISVSSNIAPHLRPGQLVVLESTVNPGVSEEIVLPILETGSNLKCGQGFSLAHCPERVSPGDDNIWRVDNISRVVGGFDKKSLQKALKFYRSIIEAEVKPMLSLKEAEAVKVVENSFRNVNIAFVNELAKSFSKLGIDVINVINGAATKPFSFLSHYPGCGIGGHCIPLDPYYLIDYAKKHGFEHELLRLSCSINEGMPIYTISLLEETMKSQSLKLSKSTVTVLGLSYKPNIDDIRESPAYEIISNLRKIGAKIKIFDPHRLDKSNVASLDDALKNSQAIILTVAHKKLTNKITPELLIKNNIKIIIDGRNCLDKSLFQKAGIIYRGIGR